MPHPTARWEIAAHDLKSLRRFYASLFDWELETDPADRFSIVRTGGGVDGFIFSSEPGVPTFVSIYIEVDDVEQHLKKAESLGGTVYLPASPSPIPGEESFGVFGDPEGNIVGVIQRPR